MASRKQREVPADLARARDRLADWRRTKSPRSRIPEALWEQAVKLVARHGLHRTARTLKLDYYSLKKRVAAAAAELGTAAGRDEGHEAFLELSPALVPVQECVLEFDEGAGTLRVHLKGYQATDIATVGRGLRGGD